MYTLIEAESEDDSNLNLDCSVQQSVDIPDYEIDNMYL